MKQNKASGKKGESLTLQVVPASSLFHEKTDIPPIRTVSPSGDEIEEPLEEFELETEEEIGTEEEEEVQVEKSTQEEVPEVPYQPQDITLEYLKSLEKISLLTPEKEVELAKRIKEGERQVKLLETKTNRLKAKLYSPVPKNGKRPHNGHKGQKAKGRNGKKPKLTPAEKREQTLLYKKVFNQYQRAVLETQQAKNELIQANLRLVVSIAKRYANRGRG